MSSSPGDVEGVFARPAGAIRLPPRGRWWVNRRQLDLIDGDVEILVADGRHVIEFAGPPEELRKLARAIVAQVDSAEANTREPEPTMGDSGYDEIAARDCRDAGRPGL